MAGEFTNSRTAMIQPISSQDSFTVVILLVAGEYSNSKTALLHCSRALGSWHLLQQDEIEEEILVEVFG